MIEKTISFKDFRDNEVTDTFAFNLSGAEVAELAMSRQGLDEYIKSIIKNDDVKELFAIFKELLGMSVGKLVNDRVFDKTPETTAYFMRSGAYEEFFFELIGNPMYAAEFIKGIMPANLEERVSKILAGKEETEFTEEDLLAMSEEEFLNAAGGKNPMRWDPKFLQIAHRRKSAA